VSSPGATASDVDACLAQAAWRNVTTRRSARQSSRLYCSSFAFHSSSPVFSPGRSGAAARAPWLAVGLGPAGLAEPAVRLVLRHAEHLGERQQTAGARAQDMLDRGSAPRLRQQGRAVFDSPPAWLAAGRPEACGMVARLSSWRVRRLLDVRWAAELQAFPGVGARRFRAQAGAAAIKATSVCDGNGSPRRSCGRHHQDAVGESIDFHENARNR
jgi:hypothetical protein